MGCTIFKLAQAAGSLINVPWIYPCEWKRLLQIMLWLEGITIIKQAFCYQIVISVL